MTAVTRLMSIMVMLITMATWMSTCNDVTMIMRGGSMVSADLEDRVDVPHGAAALAAADGVVRRVIGARALEIFLPIIKCIQSIRISI